jgi:pimeloyl-ACP methyl ester carboxylesterase
MKARLIVLSDLWGREKSEWLSYYTNLLSSQFDLVFYDCCELGRLDKSDYSEEALHKQFVNGGIEKAVQELIKKERGRVNVLAFSVGGAIGWKFALETELVETLCCVSSTRLRHETEKPKGNIQLYFGENEAHGPKSDWFEAMELNPHVFLNQGHRLYQDEEVARRIANDFSEVSRS